MTYDHRESAEGTIDDLRYGRAGSESELLGWAAACQAEATLALVDAVQELTAMLKVQGENR